MGLNILGRSGTTLAERWADGAYAYNTVTRANFPNLFFMYGANSNTGHSSIIYKLEAQGAYIAQLISKANGEEIEVKEDSEIVFVDETQQRLKTMAWAQVEDSWYKQGDKIPNNWAGNLKEYRQRLANSAWDDFKALG